MVCIQHNLEEPLEEVSEGDRDACLLRSLGNHLIGASCFTCHEKKLNCRLWLHRGCLDCQKSSWPIHRLCELNEIFQIDRWPGQGGISQQHVFVWITWPQSFRSGSPIKLWLLNVTWVSLLERGFKCQTWAQSHQWLLHSFLYLVIRKVAETHGLDLHGAFFKSPPSQF